MVIYDGLIDNDHIIAFFSLTFRINSFICYIKYIKLVFMHGVKWSMCVCCLVDMCVHMQLVSDNRTIAMCL